MFAPTRHRLTKTSYPGGTRTSSLTEAPSADQISSDDSGIGTDAGAGLDDSPEFAAAPRSSKQLLRSLARGAKTYLIAGPICAIVWMGSMVLAPWMLGQTINASVGSSNAQHTMWWCLGLFAVFALQAGAGACRHYYAYHCLLHGSLYPKLAVSQKSADIGADLGEKVGVGKVLAHSTSDARNVGLLLDITSRAVGSVVILVLVVVMSLMTSTKLGVLVAVGVPVVVALTGLVSHAMFVPQQNQRKIMGSATSVAADGIAGLRVLQGFGGERGLLSNYDDVSAKTHRAGIAVGRLQAIAESVQVLLIGTLLTAVVWVGALDVLAGRLTVGDVVAFFGWTAILKTTLSYLVETYRKVIRGQVALQQLDPFLQTPHAGEESPARPDARVQSSGGVPVLVDEVSGVVVEPGLVTGVVSGRQGEYRAIARRLAHVPAVAGSRVRVGGVLVDEVPLGVVRGLVGFCGSAPQLTAGSLRGQMDPCGVLSDEECLQGLWVVAGGDVVDQGRGGLSELLTERGRSLSGGQRQRVALARAVLSGRQVLVLEDPTSAVDSVTESLVVERVCGERVGLSTVVAGCSPLWLGVCDVVFFVCGGQVVVSGSHEELLGGEFGGAYRRAVFGTNSTEDDKDVSNV